MVHKTGLWLIIKPRPSSLFPQHRFGLPKGHIEPDEKPADAALREVWEKTGIKARIVAKITDQKYVYTVQSEKIFKIVTFYLMEYLSGEPTENVEVEKILWLPYDEAKKTLSFAKDKSILQQAVKMRKKPSKRS